LDPDVKLGALIEQKHHAKVLGHIEQASAEGARLVCGGKATLADTGGWYVEPAIFDNVTPDMSIARDEVFGPVLCVIAYQDVDEAVRIANDTCYGLAASLWTDNVNHAHKVAAKIRAGTVTVNCFGEGDLSTPFGGFKQSGFGGRDKSVYAHDQLAHRLETSVRQLERLFNTEVGDTPLSYGRQLRIRTAAWLLTSSDRTVTDIASSCGFSDASHLGREFRKSFGESPIAYRLQGAHAGAAK
jgi:AraC-like DNA-binding protein